MSATGEAQPKISVRGLSAWYAETRALVDVDLDVPSDAVTVLLGPSGSGKTTMLRCMNRMIDAIRGGRMEGEVRIDGEPVGREGAELTRLRRRFGFIAQKPDPFPRSVRENVAYGPKLHRMARDDDHLEAIVRRSLVRVGLWEELQSELDARATDLSVGQQQRLCIARAIAYEPEIFLLDEPCAGLDPIASARIENLILSLRGRYSVVVVTHRPPFAANVGDRVGILHQGRLVEIGSADEILVRPRAPATRAFLSRRDPGGG